MRHQKIVITSLLAVGLLTGYSYWALHRPLPALKPVATSNQITVRAPAGSLQWPNAQAAVGIVGSNVLETHGQPTPAPTASTAKLITALVILEQEPLQPGQPGPTITLTANDVAIYNQYAAVDGSVVKVAAGEQITEYQMLQASMLPSANNIADSLAIWKFGSLPNYGLAANGWLQSHGLKQTHVGSDASGLAPSTTSTAHDLVVLGKLAMENQVLAQIVGQPSADLPVAGMVKNVNFLLGNSGIVGIKTGNSDQAGGVFVGAAKVIVNGQPTTIVTAYIGAPNLFSAVQGSLPLIQSAEANFKPTTLVKAGQTVGTYTSAWGVSVPAVAAKTVTTQAWGGSTVKASVKLAAANAGQTAGNILSGKNPDSAVVIKGVVPPPSAWWRLTHPFN